MKACHLIILYDGNNDCFEQSFSVFEFDNRIINVVRKHWSQRFLMMDFVSEGFYPIT